MNKTVGVKIGCCIFRWTVKKRVKSRVVGKKVVQEDSVSEDSHTEASDTTIPESSTTSHPAEQTADIG